MHYTGCRGIETFCAVVLLYIPFIVVPLSAEALGINVAAVARRSRSRFEGIGASEPQRRQCIAIMAGVLSGIAFLPEIVQTHISRLCSIQKSAVELKAIHMQSSGVHLMVQGLGVFNLKGKHL